MPNPLIPLLLLLSISVQAAEEGVPRQPVCLFNLDKIGKDITDTVPVVQPGEGGKPSSVMMIVAKNGYVAGAMVTYGKDDVSYEDMVSRYRGLCKTWKETHADKRKETTFASEEQHFTIIICEDEGRKEVSVSYGPG